MTAPITLHVAGKPSPDGADCQRCHAAMSIADGPSLLFGQLYAMPDGHYATTRLATPDELRTGVLCEAKPVAPTREERISIKGYGVVIRESHERLGVTVHGLVAGLLDGPDFSSLCMSKAEAKALSQALRECIGPLDVPAMVAEARERVADRRRPMGHFDGAEYLNATVGIPLARRASQDIGYPESEPGQWSDADRAAHKAAGAEYSNRYDAAVKAEEARQAHAFVAAVRNQPPCDCAGCRAARNAARAPLGRGSVV